jgi:hypothetical protein
VVRVRAAGIGGDGVPGNADTTDQDFALVVYNAETKDVPVATLSSVGIVGGSDDTADPGESVSMSLDIKDASPVGLIGGHGTLSTSTNGISITSASSDFPNIPSDGTGTNLTAFTFTVDQAVPCATRIEFVLDVSSANGFSRMPFSVLIGRSEPAEEFTDNVEAGEAKWTHASGIKKKKKRVDTWVVSTSRFRSAGHSWFTPDPPRVTDAHLDTEPIVLPAGVRDLQLVFYHTFEFEFAFDGGVIEISTGGNFEDLGDKIIKGGYTGSIFSFTPNPLKGRPAWVEGRLGQFQQVVVDLGSFAGKTVVIRFRIGADDIGKGLGWFIDDVKVDGNLVTCSN